MHSYSYTAVDDQGVTKNGEMQAASPAQVVAFIKSQGWLPLDVKTTQRVRFRWASMFQWQPALSVANRLQFTQLLATLLEAGIPISDALLLIAQHARSKQVQNIVVALYEHLQQGLSLAQAMQQLPSHFPEAYCASVLAGESSGELVLVLSRLAEYLQNREQLGQQVKAALIYPAIILLVALGVISILLVYVVPKVMVVIANGQQELPLLTRMVLQVNYGLQNYGGYILVLILASVSALILAFRHPATRTSMHQGLLQLPLLRTWLQRLSAVYFCRTLALLLASGVPVLEALEGTRIGISNRYYQWQITQASQAVSEGQSLHQALQDKSLLPTIVMRLLASGEASGQLPGMLDKASELLEQQQKQAIRIGLALLEPIMMLVLGGLVLIIVLAVLMPVFDMNQLIV